MGYRRSYTEQLSDWGDDSYPSSSSVLRHDNHVNGFLCRVVADAYRRADTIGRGCGGIVTISLAIVGDRYPYAVQGRPMGRMFGGDRSRYRIWLDPGANPESDRRMEK